MRWLVSFVMSPRNHEEMSHVLMFIDITRAHPHYSMRSQGRIQLLQEDLQSTEEGVCGLLLCGMNFEQLARPVMDKLGFTFGLWTTCAFVHREQNMQAYVYGNNFVIKGGRCDLHDLFGQLKGHMWAKNKGVLGPDPGQGDE